MLLSIKIEGIILYNSIQYFSFGNNEVFESLKKQKYNDYQFKLKEINKKKIPDIEKKHITLPGRTIKRLGKYVAKIRIHRDVSFEFPFEVVPEEKTKK